MNPLILEKKKKWDYHPFCCSLKRFSLPEKKFIPVGHHWIHCLNREIILLPLLLFFSCINRHIKWRPLIFNLLLIYKNYVLKLNCDFELYQWRLSPYFLHGWTVYFHVLVFAFPLSLNSEFLLFFFLLLIIFFCIIYQVLSKIL